MDIRMPSLEPQDSTASSAEDEQTRGPCLLSTLPDELIAQIFGQVHAMYTYTKNDTPPPSYLRVCRRITHLARPIWLSVLCTPTEPERAEKFFAGLIRSQRNLEHVKDLELAVSAGWSDMKTAVVEHMQNLETLRLRQLDAGSAQVDRNIRDMLMRLPKLASLKLVQPKTALGYWPIWRNLKDLDFHISDPDFGVGIDTGSVRRARVHIDADKSSDLPWSALQAIEFSLDTAIVDLPLRFLQQLALKTCQEPTLSLTHLKLVFTHTRVVRAFLDYVASCFRRAAVVSLEIHLPETFRLASMPLDWPSLRILRVYAPANVSRDVSVLKRMVQRSPELCSLTLVSLTWGTTGRDILPDDDPDRASAYVRTPALYTFANVMCESTRILELRVRARDDIEEYELKWYRRAATDSFQVEAVSRSEYLE